MSIRALDWVLRESEATRGPRLVLLALADCAKSDGTYAWPSVGTLTRHTRMSERAVQYALRQLVSEGHLTVRGKHQTGTTIYDIVGVQELHRGAIADQEGVQLPAQGGATIAPEPTENRQREPSEKKTDKENPEPIGFEEWLTHHCDVTEQRMPGAGTKARAELARLFGEIMGEGEGRSLEDMKLASVGAHADEWLRERGLTRPKNILVFNRIDGLIEKGQRAKKGGKGRFEKGRFVKKSKPGEEQF